MLDRIAGTTAQAASFGSSLQTLRQTEAQLQGIASLGSQEEREELQATIDEVGKFAHLLTSDSVRIVTALLQAMAQTSPHRGSYAVQHTVCATSSICAWPYSRASNALTEASEPMPCFSAEVPGGLLQQVV